MATTRKGTKAWQKKPLTDGIGIGVGFIQPSPLEIDDERYDRQRYTYDAQPKPTVHEIRIRAKTQPRE